MRARRAAQRLGRRARRRRRRSRRLQAQSSPPRPQSPPASQSLWCPPRLLRLAPRCGSRPLRASSLRRRTGRARRGAWSFRVKKALCSLPRPELPRVSLPRAWLQRLPPNEQRGGGEAPQPHGARASCKRAASRAPLASGRHPSGARGPQTTSTPSCQSRGGQLETPKQAKLPTMDHSALGHSAIDQPLAASHASRLRCPAWRPASERCGRATEALRKGDALQSGETQARDAAEPRKP